MISTLLKITLKPTANLQLNFNYRYIKIEM